MLAKYYRPIFIVKIIVGILASVGFLLYYIVSWQASISWVADTNPAIVFVVDMQDSMGTKDVVDSAGLSYTRQQAAIKYIYYAVQSIDTGLDIGIIRLGYYPDYIVPLTRDREILGSYIESLSDAPLSPILVYQTGDISLDNYYTTLPAARYVLLTDKQSTIDTVQRLVPQIQTIHIDPTSHRADIQQREDVMQTVSYRQGGYLGWIFVLITIVGLVLL